MIKIFVVVSVCSFFVFQASARTLQKRAAFYIANETACVVDHTVYYNGDPIPTDDPCEACKCRPPGFACVLKECEAKPGCRAVRRAGHCCPDYICGCEHNGRMYRDGDEIRDSQNPCYTCECQGSSIACAFVDCFFRVDCSPDYVPGECCPRYDHCPPIGSTSKDSILNAPVHLFETHTAVAVRDPTTQASTTNSVPNTYYSTTPVPTTRSSTEIPISIIHISTENVVQTTVTRAADRYNVEKDKDIFEESKTLDYNAKDQTSKPKEDTSLDSQGLSESTTNKVTEAQFSTTLKENDSLFYNVNINKKLESEVNDETSLPATNTATELFLQSTTTEKFEKEGKTNGNENNPLIIDLSHKSNNLNFENEETKNSDIPGKEIHNNKVKDEDLSFEPITEEIDAKESSTTVMTAASDSKETAASFSTEDFTEIHLMNTNKKTEKPVLYNNELSTQSVTNIISSSEGQSLPDVVTTLTGQENTRVDDSTENITKTTTEFDTSSLETTILTASSLIPILYRNTDLGENSETLEKVQNSSDQEVSETPQAEHEFTVKIQDLLKTSIVTELSEPYKTTHATPNGSSVQPDIEATGNNRGKDKQAKVDEILSANLYTTIQSTVTTKHETEKLHQNGALFSKDTSEDNKIVTASIFPISSTNVLHENTTSPSSDTTSPEPKIDVDLPHVDKANLPILEGKAEDKSVEETSATRTTLPNDQGSTTSSSQLAEELLNESAKIHTEV